VDPLDRPVTRRQLLRATAGGVALAGFGSILAACGGESEEAAAPPPASTEPAATPEPASPEPAPAPTLSGGMKVWWWGEQEAAGIQGWVDETIAAFEEETGVTVDANLLDTGNVIPQFTDAAAAGTPPDVQFLWNGVYHMENVWRGNLAPLNGLVSDETLQASGATLLSIFQGQQYRVGWYDLGLGFSYSKPAFEEAGLDADAPPATWDELLAAAERLKAAGYIPLGGGLKDGYYGEWWLGQGLTQNLDSAADAINLFIGELDWRDPKYHEHWTRLDELFENGFMNDDMNSIELYPGIQLMDQGKLAIAQAVSTLVTASQEALGEENVGFMPMPVFGTGAMAGKPILDSQGWGIAEKAENRDAAAAFLEFMHTPERVNRIYEIAQQIPANTDFDSSLITNPLQKQIYDTWVAGENNPYVPNLMPTLFWTDAMFVASQKIAGRELDGEGAGELAAEITEKWKKQNPDLVENYSTWAADLSA
jgi:multiple sugar transport system substrate-binding protein